MTLTWLAIVQVPNMPDAFRVAPDEPSAAISAHEASR